MSSRQSYITASKPCQHWLVAGRKLVWGLTALLVLLMATPVSATRLISAEVSETNDAYRIELEMVLGASETRIRQILTDYANIGRLNPSIVASEVLGSPAAKFTRVRTEIEGCVALACLKLSRVEDVRELGAGVLRAEIVPELSDFKSGFSEWRFVPLTQGGRPSRPTGQGSGGAVPIPGRRIPAGNVPGGN